MFQISKNLSFIIIKSDKIWLAAPVACIRLSAMSSYRYFYWCHNAAVLALRRNVTGLKPATTPSEKDAW